MTSEARSVLRAQKLSLVRTLLEKAGSTPFPEEQEALAVRAYTELAVYLNSFEATGGRAKRRRERRLLEDRRLSRGAPPSPGGAHQPSSSRALAAYRKMPSRGRHEASPVDIVI
jgi:hypothetical protein